MLRKLLKTLLIAIILFSSFITNPAFTIVYAGNTTVTVYKGEETALTSSDLGHESYSFVYFESVPGNGSQLGLGSSSNPIQPGFSYSKSVVDEGNIKFFAIEEGTYTFDVRWEEYQGSEGELRDPHTDLFTITVNVVNRPPTNLKLTNTNAPADYTGLRIGNLISTDLEDDTNTFNLVSDPSDLFEVNTTDSVNKIGELRFQPGKTLSLGQTATVEIQVKDSMDNTLNKTFTITGVTPIKLKVEPGGTTDQFIYDRSGVTDVLDYLPPETGQITWIDAFENNGGQNLELSEAIEWGYGLYRDDLLAYTAGSTRGIDSFVLKDQYYIVNVGKSSSIDLTTAAFDKNIQSSDYKDITTNLTLNGNLLNDIKLNGLSIGSYNYRFDSSSGSVTIKKEYLATLGSGSHVFTFDMSEGDDPKLTVHVLTSNANLSDLTVNFATLTPGFHPDIERYDVIVKHSMARINISAIPMEEEATLTINGSSVLSGQATIVNLTEDENDIQIVVTAPNGMATKTYTIKVIRNIPPDVSNQTFNVQENVSNGTEIGEIIGHDPDGDSLTYNLTEGSGDGIFAIDKNSGMISVVDGSQLDYETKTSYTLIVLVSDGTDSEFLAITVQVTNVNDNAPTIEGASYTIAEDVPNDSQLGTITGHDIDGDSLTYSIKGGNDEGIFKIGSSNGVISIAKSSSLDFETKISHTLTIEVSDGLHTATSIVTVNLLNVNDNVPNIEDTAFSIVENAPNGTLVGTISGSDADGDDLEYVIASGNSKGIFAIDNNSGEITVADGSQLDYETTKSYTLQVTVNDGKYTNTATVTVSLKDVNDNAPVPTGFTKSIDENTSNGTVVGTVVTTDADEVGHITYKITAGNTAGAFAINPTTGVVTVADVNQLDYEKIEEFVLTIEVSDGIHTVETTVNINLNNLNDNHPILGDASFEVYENAPDDTEVGQVSGSDADHDTLIYSITSGNDEGIFKIDSSNGKISVANGSLLDYEKIQSYTLTVTVNDGKFTDTANVMVSVKDENDNAPVPSGFTATINENSNNGTFVGQVTAEDLDEDSVFSYKIISGSDAFTIDSASGAVIVADETKLDYETVKTFNLIVEVSDGLHVAETTVTINLKNVNDHSPNVEDAAFEVNEKALDNTSVGSVAGSDADGDKLAYRITAGNEEGIFKIDENGQISIAKASLMNAKVKDTYTLTIDVSDGMHHETLSATINLLSSDTTLAGLIIGEGSMKPVYNPESLEYKLDVGHQVKKIKVKPIVSDEHTLVTVNGEPVTNGEIALHEGVNKITIVVTAQNGDTKTYTLIVEHLQPVVYTTPIVAGEQATVTDEQVKRIDANGTLVVNLEKNKNVQNVSFTKEQVEVLQGQQATIHIIKEDVQLHIPIKNFADTGSLTISLEKVDGKEVELPESDVSTSAIYDLTIRMDGKIVSMFDYDIQITFPVAELGHEKPEELKIYYWNEETNEWQLIGGEYIDGNIIAYTSHFSTFGVFYPNDFVDQPSPTEKELPDTNTNIYNWLLLGILILIAGFTLLKTNQSQFNK